ncbi:hypothetical protein GA0115253_1013221 [Streptomyces sp. Termitarium-T10T-6]|nr:DUF6232 family protein [Streptomyces sp. Termitarium-T10T-6]SCD65965.1 hypothetical protein GA0115253_1013221 [Streptomyces sp. Termitarium-T10T-6]
MSPRYTTVQVRVDEGVLWVGGEAYPLRNISHVGTHTLRVDKASAWWRFVRRTVICLTFGGGLAALAGANWTVLPAAVETLLVWRHVRIISAPALYGLVLVTSGIQRDALWSADSRQMEDLVHAITMALARPDTVRATHEIQAVTASIVRQFEGESVGKAAHSGRGGDIQGGATFGRLAGLPRQDRAAGPRSPAGPGSATARAACGRGS